MTAGQLKAALLGVRDELEITVRTNWEGDTPNGVCFRLTSALVDEAHDEDATQFLALDCDQDFDEERMAV